MTHCYSNIHKIPTTILRFFTVYGPWGRPDMALLNLQSRLLKIKKYFYIIKVKCIEILLILKI